MENSQARPPIALLALLIAALIGGPSASAQTEARRLSVGVLAVTSTSCQVPSSSAYGRSVIGTPGLISYWRHGGASGTTACDSAGANHGTYQGGYLLGQSGALAGDGDTAARFDGRGSVRVGSSGSLNPTSQVTLESWVKPDTVPSQSVVRKDGQYLLRLEGGRVVFRIWQQGAASELATSAVLRAGAWHHIVSTFTGQSLNIYVNGTLVASRLQLGGVASTSSTLYLASSGSYDHLRGVLDETAIYNRALTAEQVRSHWRAASQAPPADGMPPETTITAAPSGTVTTDSAAFSFTGTDNVAVTGFECSLDGTGWAACSSPQRYGGLSNGRHTFRVRARDGAGNVDATPAAATWTVSVNDGAACAVPSSSPYGTSVTGTPGLVSYWRLGESSATNACDSMGSNGGLYAGRIAFGQAGAVGDGDAAVGLDGSSAHVRVPSGGSLNPSSAYSIEAWVKPASTSTSQTIVRKDNQYLVRLVNGTILLRVYRSDGSSSELASPAIMTAGQWQHVVATWDRETLRLFRNGVQVGARSSSGVPAQTTSPVLLGASTDYDYLGGAMDDVAFYSVALGGAQVASHFTAARGSTGDPDRDGTPPSAPSGVTAQAGDARVALSWSASADSTGVAGYRIYRQSPTGTWPATPLTSVPGPSYTDVGLTNGTRYTYRVTAYDAAGNESAASGTASATPAASPPPPPPSSSVLWRGDMEEGSLADWFFPESGPAGDYGGGEYNSDGGDSVASQERAHGGSWSVKATLPGAGGTRLFRWDESRANRDLVYEAWFYLPSAYRVTGNYWNLFQFKSRSTDGAVDPLWFVDLETTADGSLRPTLVWWHRTLEGPRPGQSGLRRLQPLSAASVPSGRWFQVKARLYQSKDFDGVLQIWLDGQLIFDQRGVRTSFANCSYNSWCASDEWSVNNYSDGLSASPTTLYIDDAQILR